MDPLEKRFGKLLGAIRRRADLNQAELAERARVSVDMISKLEVGIAAPSFRTIKALAEALDVDPAELFTAEFVGGRLQRPALREATQRLAVLSDDQLAWVTEIVDAALKARR